MQLPQVTSSSGASGVSNSNKVQDIDGALEATGIGIFHAWIVLTGGLMLYTVNSESWSIGYAISHIECEMQLALYEKTILMTIGSVGMVCTQFFWGYLSDKVGRRSVLMHSLLLGLLCSAWSVMATSFWLLATLRFLNGTFIACASGLSFAYVGEFFATRHRSVAILLMSICIGIALIATPLLAWLILSWQINLHFYTINITSWRIYLLLSGLSALFAWISLYFSPESPKFLVQASRCEEALLILKQMHKINKLNITKLAAKQTSHFEAENAYYPVEKILYEEEATKSVCIWKLFCWKYLWKTLLVCTLQGCVFATSCGLFLWYPDILQRIASAGKDVTVCEALTPRNRTVQHDEVTLNTKNCVVTVEHSVYVQNIYIGVAYTIGYVVISAVVSKIGIRNILVSFLGLASLATFGLHFVIQEEVINVLFMILLALSGICVVVVNAAVVDVFPTHVRGMAVCMAMLSGRFGSILASSFVGYLLLWNCDVTFILFGVSLLSSALLSIVLSFYLPQAQT